MTLNGRLGRLRHILRAILIEPNQGGGSLHLMMIPEAAFFAGAIVLGAEAHSGTRIQHGRP